MHHPTPNLIGIDEDADLMPWFAVNEEEFRNSRGLQRLFFRVQWIIIPLAIGVNVFNTQRQGWQYLLPILFDRKKRRAAHWIDLAVALLHWAAWLIVPMMFFKPASVLAVYAIGAFSGRSHVFREDAERRGFRAAPNRDHR